MPKKRNYNLRQFQGSSSSSQKPTDGGDSPTSSVNERLNDLRKAESLDAAQKKRELAEQSNQKSVPPELRGILGVPESAPPKPKVGIRIRDRDRMRTPGPAPPKSWLGFTPAWQPTADVKRKGKRPASFTSQRNRPGTLMRFERLVEKDGEPSGLLHSTLKKLAEQWDMLDGEDYPELISIPLRLRLRLLSYLGYYGSPIDGDALRALTQGKEVVKRLDLGGLAGHAPLTLRKLIRVLEPSKQLTLTGVLSDEVLESWDIEEATETTLSPRPIMSSRFANLTHLCLSHPPPTASWRDLLLLSKNVPQLTHLSLAHWPRPTLTPYLATATISSQHSPDIRAGGSHYYSGLDQDFAEPASLLRQLSGNLLCLQWLDLEGCAEWMPALATLAASVSIRVAEETPGQTQADEWAITKPTVMTIFTDTWRNVNYIRCAQGWMPSSAGVDALGSAVDKEIATPALKYLLDHETYPETATSDLYEIEKRRARIWMDHEMRLTGAGRRINNIRRARSCRPVIIDFGWRQKAI